MALQLKRNGIIRVRPLHGGLALWIDSAYPTTEVKPDVTAVALEEPG